MASNLHDDMLVIDGLNPSRPSRGLFEDMRAGGLAAVHVTHCRPYLRLPDTIKSLAEWKRLFRDHAEILLQVYTTADIHRAKREGRVGIILGWQDSTGFDDHLFNIPVFKELGVRVVQLTYNTANGVGFGCFDSRDGGLTDFGREVVAEMNRYGIAVDVSHCSSRTAREAIKASSKPVTYTHIAPRALCDFPRNKTDEEIRLMADQGGVIGVTLHPPFQRKGNDSTLDDYVDLIEYVINIAGEDQVGIGTDFLEGVEFTGAWWETAIRDKFHARKLTDAAHDTLRYPSDLAGIRDFANITANLERRRWPESRIRKVMGGNWIRYYEEVWAG